MRDNTADFRIPSSRRQEKLAFNRRLRDYSQRLLNSQMLAWQPFSTPVLLFWLLTAVVLIARIRFGVDIVYLYMAPLLFSLGVCVRYARKWNVIVDLALCYLTVEGMLKILSDYHPLLQSGRH
jgi:hypothetical protein